MVNLLQNTANWGRMQTVILRGARSRIFQVVILLIIAFAVSFYYFAVRPPRVFPSGTLVKVPKGSSLSEVARKLEDDGIIKSEFWFTTLAILLDRERGVVAGDYFFSAPANLMAVARRVTKGDFGLTALKITIPEGSSIYDISNIIKSSIASFDEIEFIRLAKDKEGYLFPDTYFIMPNAKPEEIVNILSENYAVKIKQAYPLMYGFGRTERDVIIMASILEGEARQMDTRRTVAGILWKRLEKGIPLQVDATFRYINGKSSADLTLDDLKIDSPYNTYRYKGLPIGPVSNPGLDSIIAAVTPIETKYYYFLTDNDGNMHYAKTLSEHEANQKKYLGNI